MEATLSDVAEQAIKPVKSMIHRIWIFIHNYFSVHEIAVFSVSFAAR